MVVNKLQHGKLILSNGLVFTVRRTVSNGVGFCSVLAQAKVRRIDFEALISLCKTKKHFDARLLELSDLGKVLQETKLSLSVFNVQIKGKKTAEIIPTRVEFVGAGKIKRVYKAP